MPNITAPGTYTKDTPGFESLESREGDRGFLFGDPEVGVAANYGTSTKIGYIADNGVPQSFSNGTITENVSKLIRGGNRDIQIVVTGGSPNFNFTMS